MGPTNPLEGTSCLRTKSVIVLKIICICHWRVLHGLYISFYKLSVPPEIKEKRLLEQTVVAGKEITMPVKFEGIPPPFVTWTVNDNSLPKSDRIFIEEREGFSELRIRQALKSDAGTYKLRLRNKAGEAETSFTINVNGNSIKILEAGLSMPRNYSQSHIRDGS